MTAPVLDVKKAVELARGYLLDVLQISASEVLLEEVEFSENQRYWLITLSYPGPVISPVQLFTGQNRTYKVVKLHADTGVLVSIKIRTLAAA
jgi:hypothetical protein